MNSQKGSARWTLYSCVAKMWWWWWSGKITYHHYLYPRYLFSALTWIFRLLRLSKDVGRGLVLLSFDSLHLIQVVSARCKRLGCCSFWIIEITKSQLSSNPNNSSTTAIFHNIYSSHSRRLSLLLPRSYLSLCRHLSPPPVPFSAGRNASPR